MALCKLNLFLSIHANGQNPVEPWIGLFELVERRKRKRFPLNFSGKESRYEQQDKAGEAKTTGNGRSVRMSWAERTPLGVEQQQAAPSTQSSRSNQWVKNAWVFPVAFNVSVAISPSMSRAVAISHVSFRELHRL